MTNEQEERDPKQFRDYSMNLKSNRLASFQDWPFDANCNCTPEKMAEAGFYHCPTEQEPDLVRCYMCYKELDGWEPHDEPREEHKSHSSGCAFLSVKKSETDLTIEEYFRLEGQRQQNRLMKIVQAKCKEFRSQAEKTRDEMEQLA
ncbi:baculoviral IAP repeat-containing protein 5-like [Amphiura filiformis]|uniref:baculoviral IAP repeat-containing protein 5-like n=1 Tax=Amphiura filiformis TaxID=82378 RepID=UPI003B224F66